jgi:hypothetical protein
MRINYLEKAPDVNTLLKSIVEPYLQRVPENCKATN